MVSSLWPPEVLGGAELYAAALAARLRTAGHTVAALTAGVDGDDVVAQIRPWGYPLTRVRRRSRARSGSCSTPATSCTPAPAAPWTARSPTFRPDVVHSHAVQGMSAAVLTRVARRGRRARAHAPRLLAAVSAQHDGDGRRRAVHDAVPLVSRDLVRPQRAARAPPARRRARRVGGGRAAARGGARVDARPDARALQPGRARRRAARRARPAGAPPTFGFLGQVSAVKGIRTLVRAFAAAAIPDARLVVAGRGTDVDAVTGVPGVDYRGWVDAAGREALYDEIDALVVPSEWEDPAPLVVNEARRARHHRDRRARRWHPRAHRAGVRAAAVPVRRRAASSRPGCGRFAADPGRFAAPAEAAPLDWAGHLAGRDPGLRRRPRPSPPRSVGVADPARG